MKHIYILFLFVSSIGFAQIPSNYYDSANGLSGFELKTQLKSITSNGHTARTYDQLYDGSGVSGSNGYVDTHSDTDVVGGTNYENDGTVLDFYSENPTGDDPYNFTHNVDEGGNQNSEGDCYNREHIIPQSSFNSNYPMQSDIHHVIPTDCRVNNYRGSYPFGNVGSVNLTSDNGSKRGTSGMAGYSGIVFEPIDEFKGDIARSLLYFATRYEDNIDGYTSFNMFNGSNNQVFFPWAIEVLLDWHNNIDPVDQRERERNNAAFNFQGNANPFVDHPEYANLIWNPSPDTEAPSTPINLVASNPTDNSIDLSWAASTDNIGVTAYDIYMDGNFAFSSNNTSATKLNLLPGLPFCFTVVAKDAAGNESGFSNESCETTTNNGDTDLTCTTETFENIGAASGSYTEVTWTGDNNLTWKATDARTDQTLDNKAITIRDGQLEATNISDIFDTIENLTVTTKRTFGGASGTFDLVVNGTIVGTIPYGDDPITTTINVNVSPVTSLVINNNSSTSNRVMFDNLSWSCGLLSVADYNLDNLKLHPNPVKNMLTVDLKSDVSTSIEIFDILGKRVLKHATSKTTELNLQNLKTGIYIIKITQGNSTVTKKLMKQ
ncbi:endonuclease [Winogradskyella costae]|uniref:endonuclease n=1 Tax=Winogradskyella costae TaxID=2697008 RepID=UPI0015C849FA|nr:endonuclease [Winogradskyella costae]